MCGIAGWYRRSGQLVDTEVIKAQCDTIIHRGPDDYGIFSDCDFGFGMRRLSIIDLEGGHQPIFSNDGNIGVVFNGEIYNFPKLRNILKEKGHVFKSNSDTEVILNGFLEWNEGLWSKLEGMFGIAVWNRKERTLSLVRDPLGIKPLFYTLQKGELAFASELKALIPIPNLQYTPSSKSINSFFAFGHIMSPDSIYSEVNKLEPGCCLTIGSKGKPIIKRFWSMVYNTEKDISESEWIERFRHNFTSTVKRHIISDVPYGAFLSGGVDSSAIVAAMSKVSPEPIRTFTIGFNESKYDESGYAQKIAEHLGCIHTCKKVEADEASKILPILAQCYDEPFADPSAIPTWYVSKLAREHVKVVLAGDGGDELFAGYTRHLNEKLVGYLNNVPGSISFLYALVNILPPLPSRGWNYMRQRLRKICHDARLESTFERFFSKNQVASKKLRMSIYNQDFYNQLDLENEIDNLEKQFSPISKDPVENFLYADTSIRLHNAMLTKVDRASMAHSLEVRVPFLSHVFVDWANTVPISLKLKGMTGKYLIRKSIEGWLPHGILERPKQGFSIPLAEWFRGSLGKYVESIWYDSGASEAGYLNDKAIRLILQEHREGKIDHSLFLYSLAMFSLWWQNRAK